MRKKWFWIGIVLSIFFLWLAFRKVDFHELGEALKSANYFWVAIAAVLNLASFLPRTYRWRFILDPIKHVNFGNAFGATTVGFMANSLLPARLGEIVRAFAIGHSENIPKSASFATILIERIFDMFVLLFFFFGFLVIFPFPSGVKKAAFVALGITFFGLGVLILLKTNPNSIFKLINFVPAKLRVNLKGFLTSFIKGLEILKDWKTMGLILGQSILIWVYFASVYYIFFRAFNFNLPIGAAFIVMVICCLGIMLPSSPGFVGTYHYFAILGLSLFHIPKSEALSFAIVAHIVSFLPVVFLGLICLQKLGLSFKETKRSLTTNKHE
ncbi:flippase-like domain-containing protein [candidate division WOR-3 bacterium]|nr:flippase-like domain-containing protein [candidate division WOR-3 bacterium]